MRISAIQNGYSLYNKQIKRNKTTDSIQNLNRNLPYGFSQIAFEGRIRNKNQAIFIGAEVAPYSKKGGVGTVMKDYANALPSSDEVIISPYYGAKIDAENKVVPVKDSDGDYILPYPNNPSQGYKLERVDCGDKSIQWGKRRNSKIMLFRLKDENDNHKHYFVFNEATAHFKSPYEGGFTYSSGIKYENNVGSWAGSPYAQFSKAAVELLPEIIKDKPNFDPATIVCSDAQTAYVHEYLAQKSLDTSDENPWFGIKPTYVGHNMGPGYCGETSKQNMFVNLGATPEQIDKIEHDPLYKDGSMGDNYFTPYVSRTLDDLGSASAVMIPIHYSKKDTANNEGYSKAFSVVAEDYADSLKNNPQAAPNIHTQLSELDSDVFSGILNPLNDPDIDASKPLPNKLYNVSTKDEKTGLVYPAFDVYPKNPTYEQMREIKNSNKLKLFKRLEAKDPSILTGQKNGNAVINPEVPRDGSIIDPRLIKLIESGQGDNVPLFVSWGRIDTQKGHDTTLDAFEKFAKTPEGRNAVLILGAGFSNQMTEDEIKVKSKIKKMLKDPELKGRVVHMDGWAPAYALASAADAAIFSSRFEPCGLTDLEAMKYYCTPIVANTQGFKQKNFDPDDSDKAKSDIATSFHTKHEFNLKKEQIEPIIRYYIKGDKDALDLIKKEFPFFDENVSDEDNIFLKFANDFKDYTEYRKNEMLSKTDDESKIPQNFDDWDELSKDYNFRFNGFAREFKDAVMAYEIADALSRYSSSPDNLRQKMFENMKNIKTGWDENQLLHPDSGKSSLQLYKEKHLQPDYSNPEAEDILSVENEDVEKTIVKTQQKDIQKRISSYAAGALAGLSGALFLRTGKSEYTVASDEFSRQIASLESKIQDAVKIGKRNTIIAAVISAAAASLITFGAIKLKAKKQKPNDKEYIVLPKSNEINLNTSKNLIPSFEEFRKLNNSTQDLPSKL